MNIGTVIGRILVSRVLVQLAYSCQLVQGIHCLVRKGEVTDCVRHCVHKRRTENNSEGQGLVLEKASLYSLVHSLGTSPLPHTQPEERR